MRSTKTLAMTLAAAAAPAMALAQTATGVTLYGVVDMSVSHQSRLLQAGVRVPGSVTTLDSGGNTGSRWGVRGREDLGGGMAALFVLEQGVQADTGVLGQGGRAFGRQSYVGLDSGFGRLTLGRQYTPHFEVLSFTEAFGNNMVGNSGNVEQANPRVDNSILYISPKFGGLRAQALVALREGGPGLHHNNVAVDYTWGSLWVAASHAQAKADIKGTMSIIGGTYDFKAVKVFGHFLRTKNIKPTSDAATPAASAAPTLLAGAEANSWHLGATVPVPTGRFIVSYIALDDKRAVNRDTKMFALGYEHFLSKRTSLYAAAARIKNQNGGAMTVNTPSYPSRAEQSMQLGVTHRF